MFTLNAFYQRALSVNILMYILLFSINLHSCRVLFFCKLRHGIFVSFFFYKMHCLKWQRRKMANNNVLGLKAYIDKMASMVIILVFSMVKGYILEHVEVDFILISRGKKLH